MILTLLNKKIRKHVKCKIEQKRKYIDRFDIVQYKITKTKEKEFNRANRSVLKLTK
jgi:hypothetical protein